MILSSSLPIIITISPFTFDLPSSEDRDKLAELLLDEGSILLGSGNYSIRFRPHLNVTEEDISFGMDCFKRALSKLS